MGLVYWSLAYDCLPFLVDWFGDSSIPASGDVVVVVVAVASATGAVAIIDAVVIARVKIVVAAVMTYLLSFLLRCVISPPSTKMMDKRIPVSSV